MDRMAGADTCFEPPSSDAKGRQSRPGRPFCKTGLQTTAQCVPSIECMKPQRVASTCASTHGLDASSTRGLDASTRCSLSM